MHLELPCNQLHDILETMSIKIGTFFPLQPVYLAMMIA